MTPYLREQETLSGTSLRDACLQDADITTTLCVSSRPLAIWTLRTRNTDAPSISFATEAARTALIREQVQQLADAMPATFARPLFAQTAAVNVWAATLSGAADVKDEETNAQRNIHRPWRGDIVRGLLFSDHRYVSVRRSVADNRDRDP